MGCAVDDGQCLVKLALQRACAGHVNVTVAPMLPRLVMRHCGNACCHARPGVVQLPGVNQHPGACAALKAQLPRQ
jgi:hypothetical protein